jgi:hypothetical protein
MVNSRQVRWVLVLAGAVLLVADSGCNSSSDTDVSGTIKLDGKAPNLKGLEIHFLGDDGKLVTAPVKEDGTYQATGVSGGEVKVGFLYYAGPDPNAPKTRRMPTPGKDKPAPIVPSQIPKNPIPDNLQVPSTSALTFRVESGKPNKFDYDIRH